MKRIRIYILLFLAVSTMNSCRKGEEDPFFSIKTRKARLAGEWQISDASWTEGDSVAIYNGADLTILLDGIEYGPIQAEYNYNFTRQGEYVINRSVTYPDNWKGNISIGFTEEYEETGKWQFTGGAGETKEKSQLLLLPNKIQTSRFIGSALDVISFRGQYEGRVINIVKLTESETKLSYDMELSDDLGSYRSSAQITLSAL